VLTGRLLKIACLVRFGCGSILSDSFNGESEIGHRYGELRGDRGCSHAVHRDLPSYQTLRPF